MNETLDPDPRKDAAFCRAGELMQRFFDRELSDEEGQELLRLWDSLADFDEFALRNWDSECFFQFQAAQEKQPITLQVRREHVIRPGLGTDSLEKNEPENPAAGPDWGELIALAARSKAIERQEEEAPHVLTTKPGYYAKPKKASGRAIHVLTSMFVILFGIGIWSEFFSPSSDEQVDDPYRAVAGFSPFAQVTASAGVRWPEDAVSVKAGQSLEKTRLQFDRGLLELKLRSGVRIALEGPVDFLLDTPERTYLERGRISATVTEQGKGFVVGTPRLTLVDHGTEFSLAVSEENVETHTVAGRTELLFGGNRGQEVTAGNGVVVDEWNKAKAIPFDPATFISEDAVQDRVSEESLEKIALWKAAAAKWNGDPALLVHFDFENTTRSIPDAAGRGFVAGGRLLGVKASQGRWMGKHALSFGRKNDAVKFELAKTMNSMTLIASVRIDSLDRFTHCLLASESLQPGAVFWQLDHDGTIQLLIQPEGDGTARKFVSPAVLSPRHCRTWCHLATVLDAEKKTVTHYLDGESVVVLPCDASLPIDIESATLGNGIWKDQSGGDRSFRGRFDDFWIFERALTPEEIKLFCIP